MSRPGDITKLPEPMNEFGKWICDCLSYLQITEKTLAEEMGVCPETICRHIRGKTLPNSMSVVLSYWRAFEEISLIDLDSLIALLNEERAK